MECARREEGEEGDGDGGDEALYVLFWCRGILVFDEVVLFGEEEEEWEKERVWRRWGGLSLSPPPLFLPSSLEWLQSCKRGATATSVAPTPLVKSNAIPFF